MHAPATVLHARAQLATHVQLDTNLMESNANSLTEVLNQKEIINVVETVPHVKEDYANNARKDFSLAQVSALHVQVTAKNV